MQARYYDPVIGRFYSNDPIGFRDVHSFNRYAYANNNPYKYVDPNGESSSLAINGARMLFVPAPGARVVGAVMIIAGVAIAYNESGDSTDKPNKPKIGKKKLKQLGKRGWTESEVEDAVNTDPIGETTDTSHDENGNRKNDPASVYGSKTDGHVVQNDETGEIIQVSDKNDPNWVPDPKIEWKDN
ncbi:MAG: hypothetical protein ACI9LX_004017 [Paraglaciecola sp.]|jgi:uncharacterized protein RhaS with RHS repeats